jgi:hypothetical protein
VNSGRFGRAAGDHRADRLQHVGGPAGGRRGPVISATDVPLIRSAIPDPAIREGVAAPFMISFMAHSL